MPGVSGDEEKVIVDRDVGEVLALAGQAALDGRQKTVPVPLVHTRITLPELKPTQVFENTACQKKDAVTWS